MADVTLTSSIRSNLLSLQNTSKLLDLTSTRLSTGKKVNSALDNPGSFFTARGLSNRASDLTKLNDGIAQAIQTLNTADQGITSITNLVEQAKSIAEQAKEAQASGTVTKLSETAVTGTTGGDFLTAAFADITTGSSSRVITINVSGAGSVVISGGLTVDSAVALISAVDSAITATFDATSLEFKVTGAAGTTIKATVSSAGINEGFLNANTAGTQAGTTSFGTAGGADISSLQTDYNKVLTSITDLVTNGDTAYKGINLLNEVDLTVNLSENNSKLTISGVDASLTGLGLSAVDWVGGNNIETTITETETAVGKLRNFASSFGTDLGILQYREDYTKELVNTLEDGAGSLVNANLEEEAANLLALQTRQSLGTQSLSISNQSQQSILSLFR